MKVLNIVTFLGHRVFTKEYDGINKELVELNCIVHNRDGSMRAQKYFVTKEKLDKMLEFRKIPSLKPDQRYNFWLTDYKGNRKLRLNGIQVRTMV